MPLRKPPHVVCYICGRLYGTTSISLHIPKCLEKWQIENSQLPRHLRRRPPQQPPGWGGLLSTNPRERESQLDAMNDMAFQASQRQLVPCKNCGRTFNPDRLPVHQRSCKPSNQPKPSKSFDSSRIGQSSPMGQHERHRTPPPPRKPKTVVCFICGREFGTKSIGIHEPQCLKKWELENSRLPKHLRRPPPTKPEILPSLSGHSVDDLERRNQMAFESSQKQLVPCRNCGRTFLPNRLEIHMRSCRSPSSKTVPLNKGPGNRLSPLAASGGQHFAQDGVYGMQSPLAHSEDLNHNILPLRKDKTFVKHSKNSTLPAGTPPKSGRPSVRLQPMADRRTPSPSINFGSGSTSFYNNPPLHHATESVMLVPCHNCGRSFAADRLAKHQSICTKSSSKKRRVFDSTKMRTQGTEAAKYNRAGARKPGGDAPKPKSNWRKKHEEFIHAIRDAKKVQEHIRRGGKVSDFPPPRPSENPDYVFCRFCQRRFAPEVAERHIPKCQSIVNRPTPPRQRALQAGSRGAYSAGRTFGKRVYR